RWTESDGEKTRVHRLDGLTCPNLERRWGHVFLSKASFRGYCPQLNQAPRGIVEQVRMERPQASKNANTTPGVANNPGAQETEVGRLLLIQGQPWRHSIQGQSQPELHSTC
ncbi:mCG142024, partial [Mus musculus]